MRSHAIIYIVLLIVMTASRSAWCVEFYYEYVSGGGGTYKYRNHSGKIDMKQTTINGVQCSVQFPDDITEFTPKEGLKSDSLVTVTTRGRFFVYANVVEEKEVVLISSKGMPTYNGGKDCLKFESFNMPDEYWPDVNLCTCNGNCPHCCTCDKNTKDCNGTYSASGCACHKNDCRCGGKCSHCCTCGIIATVCPGTVEACNCHNPDCTCFPNPCCGCNCLCGKMTGPKSVCDGTVGIDGCYCHGMVCECDSCCQHTCTCGKNLKACDKTDGPNGCTCHGENACTCGACCSCKCFNDGCGKWIFEKGGECAKHCDHGCEHDPAKGKYCDVYNKETPHPYTHCECHHATHDDDCCEHHKKDYIAPPDVDFGSLGEIPGFNVPSKSVPGYNGGPGLPSLPGIGGGSLPSFEGPSESNPFETQPLIWFERGEGDFDFPTFKYEDLFDSIEEKFKEKFPLDWLEKLTTTDGTKIDLSWKVEFDWYEQKYGPWEFDLSEHVEAYEKMDISRIIRLILLFILCWIFLNSVLSLIFDSKA